MSKSAIPGLSVFERKSEDMPALMRPHEIAEALAKPPMTHEECRRLEARRRRQRARFKRRPFEVRG